MNNEFDNTSVTPDIVDESEDEQEIPEHIREHIEKFGVEPNIIGMFWSKPDVVKNKIIQAIKDNKPYDEYLLLSEEGKKAFDDGLLFF